MSEQPLQPLNGTMYVNATVAVRIVDGVAVDAVVTNPDHIEITENEAEMQWREPIADELEQLWDPARQPQSYFDRRAAYFTAAVRVVYPALARIGLRK